ncbi:hypothetical protein CsSME_00022257 [Camellia sinensis var. sinensis]
MARSIHELQPPQNPFKRNPMLQTPTQTTTTTTAHWPQTKTHPLQSCQRLNLKNRFSQKSFYLLRPRKPCHFSTIRAA